MPSANSSPTILPRPCNSPGTPISSRRTKRRQVLLPLQQRDQARRIPALAAHLLYFRIELIDQRRGRQMSAVAPRFGQADAEVLAHPVHREAEIELAGGHGLVA